MNGTTICLALAFICFLLAAANAPLPRVNLVAPGLMFYIASLLLPAVR